MMERAHIFDLMNELKLFGMRSAYEHHQPWALCRVSDGRGRHSQKSFRRHPAHDCGTPASARYIDCVSRSIFHAFERSRERCVLIKINSTIFRHSVEPYGPQKV